MEINKEEVREKAKQIMDDFMKALSEVEEVKLDYGEERDTDVRVDLDNKYEDESFRKNILENAETIGKEIEDNQMVSERKKW